MVFSLLLKRVKICVSRIAEAIRKRGIKLNGKELESLVDDIAEELSAASE